LFNGLTTGDRIGTIGSFPGKLDDIDFENYLCDRRS